MYTIVVADDEEELRKAIIRKIEWEKIGFQLVGEAENGAEALEMVEKMKPDLLLSDIRMPFISGIELARQVREIRPGTNIAFLSGFDDFSYAQQAIQYNIISYMLKPISVTELTEELIKIKDKIDAKFNEFIGQQKVDLEVSGFLLPLLLDDIRANDYENSERYLRNKAIACGVMRDENNDFRYAVITTSVVNTQGINCTSEAISNSIDSIVKKYMKCESFYSEGKVITLLIATPVSFEKYLHILVEEIIQTMERIMQLQCRVGVSRVADKLARCHEAYREAMKAMSYSECDSSEVLYIADEERGNTFDAESMVGMIGKVENLIRSGSEKELTECFQQIFDTMMENRVSTSTANFMLVQLLSSVCRIAYAVSEMDVMPQLQEHSMMSGLSFFNNSYRDIQGEITKFCLEVREMIAEQKKKSSKVFCEKTLEIIEKEFGDAELSLVSVSNEISVSPNYLSALVKKMTGYTFVELLTKKRIETAKELLLCTPMKIREISEKCGYNDQHYFSYCFKKYSGISPNALRQQNNEQG